MAPSRLAIAIVIVFGLFDELPRTDHRQTTAPRPPPDQKSRTILLYVRTIW